MPTSDSIIHVADYREIPGCPGYKSGKDGRILSCLVRKGLGKGMGKGSRFELSDTWKPLNPVRRIQRPNGPRPYIHLAVTIRRNGKLKILSVARLVLETFVGPCPPGYEACHYPDPDPTNCRLENLQWNTRLANTGHMIEHGNIADQKGEANGNSKLSDHDIAEVRCRLASGEYQKAIAADMKLSQSTISLIATRKRWSHI